MGEGVVGDWGGLCFGGDVYCTRRWVFIDIRYSRVVPWFCFPWGRVLSVTYLTTDYLLRFAVCRRVRGKSITRLYAL
jgi:hypothetical protein